MPNLRTYVVGLHYGTPPNNRMLVNAIVAETEGIAAAQIAHGAAPHSDGLPLTGIAVSELTEEFLRRAVNGLAEAQVVPLRAVETPAEPAQGTHTTDSPPPESA